MDEALDRYFDHFGENYPIVITETRSSDEIMDRIEYCIRNNVKEEEPIFDDDLIY